MTFLDKHRLCPKGFEDLQTKYRTRIDTKGKILWQPKLKPGRSSMVN